MTEKNPNTQMPKWMVYGIIGKVVFIVIVLIALLIYAGVI
jgi:hypothetical protein